MNEGFEMSGKDLRGEQAIKEIGRDEGKDESERNDEREKLRMEEAK